MCPFDPTGTRTSSDLDALIVDRERWLRRRKPKALHRHFNGDSHGGLEEV